MTEKLRDENSEDVNDPYVGQYNFFVNAEKMKRYIMQETLDYYLISDYEIVIKLKNGDKFIYDNFYNIVKFQTYDNDNLTEEQERKEFAKNLKKLLAYKRITQEGLAEKLGTSQTMISRYINGQYMPSSIVIRKISKILNCSIDDLFYKHY